MKVLAPRATLLEQCSSTMAWFYSSYAYKFKREGLPGFAVSRNIPLPFIQQETKLCWQMLDTVLFWTWQHEPVCRVAVNLKSLQSVFFQLLVLQTGNVVQLSEANARSPSLFASKRELKYFCVPLCLLSTCLASEEHVQDY